MRRTSVSRSARRPSAPEADGSWRDAEVLSLLRGPRGGTETAKVARRVVEAATAGDAPDPDDLQALADAVLETPEVRAALEVRASGPWALARALELAAWALDLVGDTATEHKS